MEMTIKGIQVTRVEIKKNCRDLHGIDKALDEAFNIIKKRYIICANQEINKNATFFLYLTIDSFKTES